MIRRPIRLLPIALMAVAAAVLIAGAYGGALAAGTPPIERVSVASDGSEASIASSDDPSMSAAGTRIAFESSAGNLVPNDTNNKDDIFVRDTVAGTTTRVSVDSAGVQGNNHSRLAAISADGTKVAFVSWASNLVPGDTNVREDVFVHDLTTGTTERVSLAHDGSQVPGVIVSTISISGDGTRIAWVSSWSTYVPNDTNGKLDVFVRDTVAGTTTRVSVGTDGGEAAGNSSSPSLSADGTRIAFESDADNLVAGDANLETDVFLHDLTTGATTRASLADDGSEASGGRSLQPSLNADGTKVAFESRATNLVAGDTNGAFDVFVRDTEAGTTTRVSVADDGSQANESSGAASINSDGTRVAFHSVASNLVAGDTNTALDVFVRNIAAGTTERISLSDGGAEAPGISDAPSINGSGTRIAFNSRVALVPDDTNGLDDAYVADTDCCTDTDGDGLTDGQEAGIGTNPTDPDTDDDGLTDGTEVDTTSTNPLVADTDGDGLGDGAEVTTHSTNPLDPDTDGDGLGDGAEITTHATNPLDPDTDADGLTDGTEITTHATNPLDPDTDGDGLTDGPEVDTHGTDALLADTDGDGLTDGAEITTHATNPLLADTDADGLTDGPEVDTYGTDPLVADTDSDTLTDGAETNTHGTDPLAFDTDGDGAGDGAEVTAGTDPTEPPAHVALFNATAGQWHLRSDDGSTTSFFYGNPGDVPLMGDWDCDGIDTVGMFRPANGFAYLRNTNDFGVADIDFFFGIAGDIPIVGDWDGDGCDSLGVFRDGHVFLTNALETSFADVDFWFGIPGDRPFAGDFDSDGFSEVGLFRESTGFAYMRWDYTDGVADHDFYFGIPGDQIIAGDWDNDYQETVGIWRSSAATFYLANTNDTVTADEVISFGSGAWLPAAGNFN